MVELESTHLRKIRLTEAQVRDAIQQYILKNTRGPIPPPDADMEVRYTGAIITWQETEAA